MPKIEISPPGKKDPFNIDVALQTIDEAIKPFAKAAMFELADQGFRSVFEQLVACLISIRTRDEVTVPTARRLFGAARTAREISQLETEEIDKLIRTCTFHEAKARTIRNIALETVAKHGGNLPADVEVLRELPGVGPKCAHLALGVASGQGLIGVDI